MDVTNLALLADATEADSSKDTGSYDGSLPLYSVSIVHWLSRQCSCGGRFVKPSMSRMVSRSLGREAAALDLASSNFFLFINAFAITCFTCGLFSIFVCLRWVSLHPFRASFAISLNLLSRMCMDCSVMYWAPFHWIRYTAVRKRASFSEDSITCSKSAHGLGTRSRGPFMLSSRLHLLCLLLILLTLSRSPSSEICIPVLPFLTCLWNSNGSTSV